MTSSQRNTFGSILWSVLAVIFGIIVLIPMIAREYYQYIKYLKPCNLDFEFEDVKVYGMLILIFSFFHYFIMDFFFTKAPWWLSL